MYDALRAICLADICTVSLCILLMIFVPLVISFGALDDILPADYSTS